MNMWKEYFHKLTKISPHLSSSSHVGGSQKWRAWPGWLLYLITDIIIIMFRELSTYAHVLIYIARKIIGGIFSILH